MVLTSLPLPTQLFWFFGFHFALLHGRKASNKHVHAKVDNKIRTYFLPVLCLSRPNGGHPFNSVNIDGPIEPSRHKAILTAGSQKGMRERSPS